MGLGHVARERQQQRHRVLGRGDHVRLRRVGDDDPALGRGVDVDVVDPDAGPAHRPEPLGPRDQRRVELGRRADQNPVELADALLELLARPPDAQLDVEMLTQQLDARIADVLGHQDAEASRLVNGNC